MLQHTTTTTISTNNRQQSEVRILSLIIIVIVMVVASSMTTCLIVTENTTTVNVLKQSISIGMLLSSSSNMYRIFSWISLYSDLFLQRYTPILSKVSIFS